jgi:hypothetical protein
METKKVKRLPYGISDFGKIRTEDYAYIDKTLYIEKLENENNSNLFFIRPRKFGKSLFFSTLSYYYDINQADKFDILFGDLYIGKHPTPKRNKYLVLNFNFSGLNPTDEAKFDETISQMVQDSVLDFLEKYEYLFPKKDIYFNQINAEQPGVGALRKSFSAAKSAGKKIYAVIDEYDHFANDFIAQGTYTGDDAYRHTVRANGIVRDFYEILKTGCDTVIDHIILTGVTPIMLDDLTSGFNISNNISLNPKYNEMLGFTKEEVEILMDKTGVDRSLINVDMELYYNGYLFHKDAKHRVYNPAMMLYFFNQLLDSGKPENIIDLNLKTDYGRLQRLTQNDKNRETLIQLVKTGGIGSEILLQFSIDAMNDERNFISLLFYMGILTIKKPYLAKVWLDIPNYSIRTVYWEYIMILASKTSPDMTIQYNQLDEAISALAMEGDIQRFIGYVSENAFSKLSDHDLQHFDEKYIQILLLAYLFMSKMYIPMSEYEAVPGRADIFLQRNPNTLQVKYEWIFELKYCKTGAKEEEISEKRKEGWEQLTKYTHSYRLGNRPDMKAALIVFIGKNKFEITEFKEF